MTLGLIVPAAATARVAARSAATGIAMWGAAARVHVRGSATATRVTARGSTTNLTVRHTRARVTTVRGASTRVATRGAATNLTVRSTCPWTTTARGGTTEVAVLSASTGVAMRGSAAGAATGMCALVDVITRYRVRVRVPTTGRPVTLATGSTTSARATAMRYIVRGASTRATATRGNNSLARELARSRSRGHGGPAVIERRMQLFVSESRVLVITL